MAARLLPSIGILACLIQGASAFSVPSHSSVQVVPLQSTSKLYASTNNHSLQDRIGTAAAAILLITAPLVTTPLAAYSADGASTAANAKITTGGASTLQSGRTIAITRGVNLDNSDFKGQNLKGVAFQQSIVRDSDFSGSNLYGASFFDATLDGSNFEGAGKYLLCCAHVLSIYVYVQHVGIYYMNVYSMHCTNLIRFLFIVDMSLCNVEMAQFNRANLKVCSYVLFDRKYC